VRLWSEMSGEDRPDEGHPEDRPSDSK
jgi:hypothetical protein